MASTYKGLQRCVNVSANNSETVGHKDLRLGKIVYILVIYNNSFSWLLPLDGFQFNLLLGDSENDLLCNYNRTSPLARGGGVLPYMGYICMCRFKGYGFQVVYSRIGYYINQSVWV